MDGWVQKPKLHQLTPAAVRALGAHSSLPFSDSPSGGLWSTTVGVLHQRVQMLLIRIFVKSPEPIVRLFTQAPHWLKS